MTKLRSLFILMIGAWMPWVATQTAAQDASEQLGAEELVYDWDALVNQTVSFGAQVIMVDLPQKVIPIGSNMMHQVKTDKLNKKDVLYVAKQVDTYHFWMDVTGKPARPDEYGLIHEFYPSEAEFFGLVGVAATTGGRGYMSYAGASDAETTLSNAIVQNGLDEACCASADLWVPVSDLVKGPMYLSAFVLGGNEDLGLFAATGHSQESAKAQALQQCNDTRNERGILEMASYQCAELFAEPIFQ